MFHLSWLAVGLAASHWRVSRREIFAELREMLIPAVRARKALERGEVADLDEAVTWWGEPSGSRCGTPGRAMVFGHFSHGKNGGSNGIQWGNMGDMELKAYETYINHTKPSKFGSTCPFLGAPSTWFSTLRFICPVFTFSWHCHNESHVDSPSMAWKVGTPSKR